MRIWNPGSTKRNPHEVHWMFSAGYGIEIKFACSAPEGAKCRLMCSEGCEFWLFSDHEHELVDGGECMVLPWLNELSVSEIMDAYFGDTSMPIDGPVDFKYFGEYVVEWSYATAQKGE